MSLARAHASLPPLTARERAKRASTSARASSSTRNSPDLVRDELSRCFDLVERLGRGAVYIGSARVPESHPHYALARALARDMATELNCTTWSGAGAGMMDAAIRGGEDAGKPVGGIMISLEAGGARTTPSRVHPYLPASSYLCARFFSARKHGLVDAGTRVSASDRTAFIVLPGGVGTLDEMFEILALRQLKRVGVHLPAPLVVMNYDGCYDGLLEFLRRDMVDYGALAPDELTPHMTVCATNAEAIHHVREFYAADARARAA